MSAGVKRLDIEEDCLARTGQMKIEAPFSRLGAALREQSSAPVLGDEAEHVIRRIGGVVREVNSCDHPA
jgi:hypothetical protein